MNATEPRSQSKQIHHEISRGRHAAKPLQTSNQDRPVAMRKQRDPIKSGLQTIFSASATVKFTSRASDMLRRNSRTPSSCVIDAHQSIRDGWKRRHLRWGSPPFRLVGVATTSRTIRTAAGVKITHPARNVAESMVAPTNVA